MNDEVLASFDALFEALLKRGDADEAMRLFVDGDVAFWGSGREEQALGHAALRELFRSIAEIGDALVSMVLIAAATSSMCPYSSAAMLATRS